MARLHEYEGKTLLRERGVAVPRGHVLRSAGDAGGDARAIIADLGPRVVLKIQAWVTGRKDRGGVVFVDNEPEEVARQAESLLGMRFGNFPVTEVLAEEVLDIAHELFVSLSVDDAAQAPVLLLDTQGGTGIEDRAAGVARIPVSATEGIDPAAVEDALRDSPIPPEHHAPVVEAIASIVDLARTCEARSLEVNPLVVTTDGRVMAADCRLTIDDYAVFRHPELGIEIARELDHPATELERIAYRVESEDHRGTFYFAQLPTDGHEQTRGLIGFHGAGGGGSMMSMDAATHEGFTLANFCDTSGNPSAAKVYRAARIILTQPGLVGYFGSGSGVASQEQFHSAYGLAKAFNEVGLNVPAVVRLGGNSEDRAVEILGDACRDLSAVVEGYRKDDTPAACAVRFATLVEEAKPADGPMRRRVPDFVGAWGAPTFMIDGGCVWIDHTRCDETATRVVIEHAAGLLRAGDNGLPEPAIDLDEIRKRDSELIACEIECARAGHPVLFVDLPVLGLDPEYDDEGVA